jgi:hypothetical protein
MISFPEYERLLGDRPAKFDADDVEYREAEGPERCSRCIHFFQSKDRATCEIFRPDDDQDVDANWVCQFYSFDGEEYPLLGEKEHVDEAELESESEPEPLGFEVKEEP